MKNEADARRAFLQSDYNKALLCSVKWMEEMPFATSPIGFAAEIAYTYIKDYASAIKILKIGRNTNPYDLSFINNLAYSYALNGDLKKAEETLSFAKPLSAKMSITSKICIKATEGLIEYRRGNVAKGRQLYFEAIDMARNSNQGIMHKAILNYMREDVRATGQCNEQMLNQLDYLNTGNERETIIMRQDVRDLLLLKK